MKAENGISWREAIRSVKACGEEAKAAHLWRKMASSSSNNQRGQISLMAIPGKQSAKISKMRRLLFSQHENISENNGEISAWHGNMAKMTQYQYIEAA